MTSESRRRVFDESVFGRFSRAIGFLKAAGQSSRLRASLLRVAAGLGRPPLCFPPPPEAGFRGSHWAQQVFSALPATAIASLPWVAGHIAYATAILVVLLAAMAFRALRSVGPRGWLTLLLLAWLGFAAVGPSSGNLPAALWPGLGFGAVAWLAFPAGARVSTAHWIRMTGATAVALSILVLVQTGWGWGDVAGWMPQSIRTVVPARAVGTLGNPNTLAAAVNLLLWPMAFDYIGRRTLSRRWLQAGAIVGLWVVIFLTFSRGAWLGAAVALGLLMVQSAPQVRRRAGALLAVLALLVLLGPAGALLTPSALGGALAGRLEIWRAALACFMEHPVLGAGPGAFRGAVLPGGMRTFHAHHMVLQILAEWGIIGAVPLVLLLTRLVAQAVRLARDRRGEARFAAGLGAGLCAVMVQGMFDYPWASPTVSLLWWAWVGFFLGRGESLTPPGEPSSGEGLHG